MGIMPEDRGRRWKSVFRRYGISDGNTADTEQDALKQLTKNATDSLFADPGAPHKDDGHAKPSPRKRSR